MQSRRSAESWAHGTLNNDREKGCGSYGILMLIQGSPGPATSTGPSAMMASWASALLGSCSFSFPLYANSVINWHLRTLRTAFVPVHRPLTWCLGHLHVTAKPATAPAVQPSRKTVPCSSRPCPVLKWLEDYAVQAVGALHTTANSQVAAPRPGMFQAFLKPVWKLCQYNITVNSATATL